MANWAFIVFHNMFDKTFIYRYLLLVVQQNLIGSQVMKQCPPLFVVHEVQAVAKSREIENIPQI